MLFARGPIDGMLTKQIQVCCRCRIITAGDSPGAAWAISELPRVLFPNAPRAKASAAVDALLELASLAKSASDGSPILPARVHMLFRGLPGLWACANPNCSEIAPAADAPPVDGVMDDALNRAFAEVVRERHAKGALLDIDADDVDFGSPAEGMKEEEIRTALDIKEAEISRQEVFVAPTLEHRGEELD